MTGVILNVINGGLKIVNALIKILVPIVKDTIKYFSRGVITLTDEFLQSAWEISRGFVLHV